jgi:putative cell wall-binding protein
MHTARRIRPRLVVALLALALFALQAPAARAAETKRIAGNDRYATAAKISEQSFDPGVTVAFVATGEAFPDALSAGPAAAHTGSPVLLTRTSALPEATRIELERLVPGRIIVMGGTAAVSDAVVDDLKTLTTGTVDRVAGVTRYETSALVSALVFAAPVSVAYVATGVAFADALSGAPSAGALGGPLLLARPDGLPGVVANELARIQPQLIVILGGTGAVSSYIEDQLKTFSPNPVQRRAGADRYLTAVEVSKKYDPPVAAVYLATGSNYPDALAGGSPAGIARDPLLLVHADCIPPEVSAEIDRLNPTQIIVLGAQGAVSNEAAAGQVCEADS